MSNTPQLDLQLDREPVFTVPPGEILQSVVPLSVPGSGVPAAARCHSWFVASARCAGARWTTARWSADPSTNGGPTSFDRAMGQLASGTLRGGAWWRRP